MLIQADASHHRWLEDRGQEFTPLVVVDDATVYVAGALFLGIRAISFMLIWQPSARPRV